MFLYYQINSKYENQNYSIPYFFQNLNLLFLIIYYSYSNFSIYYRLNILLTYFKQILQLIHQ